MLTIDTVDMLGELARRGATDDNAEGTGVGSRVLDAVRAAVLVGTTRGAVTGVDGVGSDRVGGGGGGDGGVG